MRCLYCVREQQIQVGSQRLGHVAGQRDDRAEGLPGTLHALETCSHDCITSCTHVVISALDGLGDQVENLRQILQKGIALLGVLGVLKAVTWQLEQDAPVQTMTNEATRPAAVARKDGGASPPSDALSTGAAARIWADVSRRGTSRSTRSALSRATTDGLLARAHSVSVSWGQ